MYHEMIAWYNNKLFRDINPRDKSPKDDDGEGEVEMDPNELFFQLQEKEWEDECTLEVRLWLCGLDP